VHPNVIQSPSTGRALTLSLVLHAIVVITLVALFDHDEKRTEVVDIEIAPVVRPVEALPEEVARPWEQDTATKPDEASAAATATEPQGDFAIDAGVPDAPPPDAAPKKKRPDAAMIAEGDDAGIGDGGVDPLGDGGEGDATQIATSEGSGSAMEGSGAGSGGPGSAAGGRGEEPPGAGSGSAGATNEPAVPGAPTRAGTAANLLGYFPKGHVVTAMIRFDRLRGTEWEKQTERLLRPMPDYQVLFGATDAEIAKKLDTLVISSAQPRDATATTLVAHTRMDRASLRDFLGKVSPVTWSASKGGLLGKRTNKLFPNDKRVFISPFKDWFLLAQPGDVSGLTAAAPGSLDTVVASAKLPPWIAGIRGIEAESGEPLGPALVLTLALGGERIELGADDFGLGIKSVTTPDRVTLAMELAKDGWHVSGNMRFTSDQAATDFIAAAEAAKQRVADSRALQLALGKPVARVIERLQFARTGPRVSYTTSISIADARAILAVAAQQLDAFFAVGAGSQ
jgi:hypothetical protein